MRKMGTFSLQPPTGPALALFQQHQASMLLLEVSYALYIIKEDMLYSGIIYQVVCLSLICLL